MRYWFFLSILCSAALVGCQRSGYSTPSIPRTPESKATCRPRPGVAEALSLARMSTESLGVAIETNEPKPFVPKGFEVTVVVDTACWSRLTEKERNNVRAVFPVQEPRLGQKISSHQSMQVSFTKPVEMSVVETFVQAHPCLVALGNAITHFNQQVSNSSPDPLVSRQRFHDPLGSASAWERLRSIPSTKPVVVAIIDGGGDLNHEDLKDHRWKNTGEIPNNGVDDDHNGYVDDAEGYDFARDRGIVSGSSELEENYHGTHVAGLIAAVGNNGLGVRGVIDTGVQLMFLNVFGDSNGARTADIDSAIRYAADNGAQVINLSVGGPGRAPSTELALRYAVEKGVTVVVAAGNGSHDLSRKAFTPAMYSSRISGVLSVASVRTDSFAFSTFSNRGPKQIEIAAFGEGGMASTIPGNRYAFADGTSMAAPLVTGAAALVYRFYEGRFGAWPAPSQVEEIILAGARVQDNLKDFVGEGRLVSVEKLWSLVERAPQLTPVPTPTPTLAPIASPTPSPIAPILGPVPTLTPAPALSPAPSPTLVPAPVPTGSDPTATDDLPFCP